MDIEVLVMSKKENKKSLGYVTNTHQDQKIFATRMILFLDYFFFLCCNNNRKFASPKDEKGNFSLTLGVVDKWRLKSSLNFLKHYIFDGRHFWPPKGHRLKIQIKAHKQITSISYSSKLSKSKTSQVNKPFKKIVRLSFTKEFLFLNLHEAIWIISNGSRIINGNKILTDINSDQKWKTEFFLLIELRQPIE